MSKILSICNLHERVLNTNDEELAYYSKNLPHSDEIADLFIKQWNEDADKFMLKIMNEQVGKDRLKSCYARRYKKNSPETLVAIEIITKDGIQLRGTMKDDVYEFIGAQFSDGWGEGFFGMININTAKDGTRFCIE